MFGGGWPSFYLGKQDPFIKSPLVEIFAEMGLGSFDQVLAGTFVPPPECKPYTVKELVALVKPELV